MTTENRSRAKAKPAATAEEGGWGELFRTVLYAVLIAFGIRTLAFEPFNIPSGSMIPTLLVGDYLFVSKFGYGYSRYSLPAFLVPGGETPVADGCGDVPGRLFGSMPERGDVAVFKLPTEPGTDYIKRIVGLPCDRVQVIDGILHINGEAVKRERLPDDAAAAVVSWQNAAPQYLETLPEGRQHRINELRGDAGALDNTPVYVVPPGHVFAMGDNRDNSQDSRVLDLVGFIPLENIVGEAKFIFFSLEEGASFWQVWKWPTAIRFGRLFDRVE